MTLDDLPVTSDPIEDLKRACELIRQSTGGERPNCIVLGPWVAPAMVKGLTATKRRAEKTLRSRLSGRYDKRRRQRLSGVAARLRVKHQIARIILAHIDEDIAAWERLIPAKEPSE